MTDLLSRSTWIELGRRRVRPLCQRGCERGGRAFEGAGVRGGGASIGVGRDTAYPEDGRSLFPVGRSLEVTKFPWRDVLPAVWCIVNSACWFGLSWDRNDP